MIINDFVLMYISTVSKLELILEIILNQKKTHVNNMFETRNFSDLD